MVNPELRTSFGQQGPGRIKEKLEKERSDIELTVKCIFNFFDRFSIVKR